MIAPFAFEQSSIGNRRDSTQLTGSTAGKRQMVKINNAFCGSFWRGGLGNGTIAPCLFYDRFTMERQLQSEPTCLSPCSHFASNDDLSLPLPDNKARALTLLRIQQVGNFSPLLLFSSCFPLLIQPFRLFAAQWKDNCVTARTECWPGYCAP